MHVVHAVPSLHPRQGGPSRSVAALANSLASLGMVTITLARQAAAAEPSLELPDAGVIHRVHETRSGLDEFLGLAQRRGLETCFAAGQADLVHSHALWHSACHWAVALSRKHGIRVVSQPRGMLEPWALRQKQWKKRLALFAYQRRDLESPAALVATSEMEFESLRLFGLRQPVAIIPNGVELPAVAPFGTGRAHDSNRRVVLFLSRIHPKKGLIELVQAWARCDAAGWLLRIAGPDQGGHLREVIRTIESLGLQGRVEYAGEVEGEAKSGLYRAADLFVLPTFSENFGSVVAEALAYGVPVITTRGAPWAALPVHGCGWWIGTGVEPLVDALREATGLTDHARREMGERGRAYVARFAWSEVALQTMELYRWILGKGHRPACVRVD